MLARSLAFALTALIQLLGCSTADGGASSTGGATTLNGGSTQGGNSNAPNGGTTTIGSGGLPGASGMSSSSGGSFAAAGMPSTGGAPLGNGGTIGSGSSLGMGGTQSGGTSTGGTATGGISNGGASTTGGASAKGGAGSGGASGGSGGPSNAGAATGGSGGATDTASVRIVGRSASAAGAPRFSWPGVSLNARFNGSQVSMALNDGSNKNRFTVVVDGGAPKTVVTSAGQTSLQLASGLSNGAHDLVIWRNTEASGGVSTFAGLSNFGAGGALLAPATAPDRRIEVIGDSISAGAGVEGTSTSCSPNIDAFTNNYLAYGSVAARSVKADVVTIAWSGIGVYRSYSASDPTMPARYDYSIPNDQTAWDFSKYQPHVVVINLGTNDFGSGNPGQPYVDAYVAFVEHVRSKYANANVILIDMYGGERVAAINQVVSTLKSGGESKIEVLSFSSVPNNNTACNQHPNAAAQKAMGDLLANRLKSLMGW